MYVLQTIKLCCYSLLCTVPCSFGNAVLHEVHSFFGFIHIWRTCLVLKHSGFILLQAGWQKPSYQKLFFFLENVKVLTLRPRAWGKNLINPTVMVDAGNWHVFHTCQAAWRALTRPIKVYRRAAGPSIMMTDRSGPSPSAGARAAEGRGRSGIGEPRGAGLKGEDSWGTSVLTLSQTAQQESVNEWPAGLTHADFSPLHMGPLTSSHVGMVVFTRWTRLQLVPVGNSGLPLRPDFLS